MSLKHVNIAVSDVVQTKAFFETYFGFRCLELKGDFIAILHDDDGFILTISNFKKGEIPQYPADFHVGFVQETPEKVMEIYQRMKADGIDVGKEPRNYAGRGTMSFYVPVPGNFLIEVLCIVE
ncbi:VOC family protein [Spirosoma sp. KCTC 42546]|uniref:VOC family protein n=1 Tax=Spirosoma sp. KCTC 42546 TaxID=2520506 RepID=UPI00115AE472|nr:VOC family protein [Spirosoma sp. KCTC 42546]QDK78260.1 VOC family protein [Spirosoma sp. KCTC 42546]